MSASEGQQAENKSASIGRLRGALMNYIFLRPVTTTVDIAELDQNPRIRVSLREAIKARSRRVLAWILGLSAIFLPLIIGGAISLAFAYPAAIFTALSLGAVAAATPAGWAVLGLLAAALVIGALIVIVRAGLELAERGNWGNLAFSITPYQSMLAMITRKEKDVGPASAQEMQTYSQQHPQRGQIPGFHIESVVEPAHSSSVATSANETKVALATTPLQSLAQKLAAIRPEDEKSISEVEVLKGSADRLREYIANPQQAHYEVNDLTDLQAFLGRLDQYLKAHPKSEGDLRGDMDRIIVGMLQSTGAQNFLLDKQHIKFFAKMVTKEHLEQLDFTHLQAIVDKFCEQNYSQVQNPKSDHGKAVKTVDGLLEAAVDARSESQLSQK